MSKAIIVKLVLVLGAALWLAGAPTTLLAEQQFYPKDGFVTWDRENLAGGVGTLAGKFSFTRNDAKEAFVIKEIGWLTLPPGASVGLHKHEDNEDAFIIVSGKGLFTDSDGTKTEVGEGDVTIARPGDSHALENIGTGDLIFIAVLAKR
ncbi:MAG: cupin domain-containing protein [Deltaproteobacteria bacterium]|jgi:mannose-6-phosphate isomerase-like protein (cupin superfamily)|nr:cupin domain-containing protein [Deltaproteobacteria bacterium]